MRRASGAREIERVLELQERLRQAKTRLDRGGPGSSDRTVEPSRDPRPSPAPRAAPRGAESFFQAVRDRPRRSRSLQGGQRHARGPAAGDDVLREAARSDPVRDARLRPDRTRHGGEEFHCCCCRAATEPRRARSPNGCAPASPRRRLSIGEVELIVSVSLGAAWTTSGGVGPSRLDSGGGRGALRGEEVGSDAIASRSARRAFMIEPAGR